MAAAAAAAAPASTDKTLFKPFMLRVRDAPVYVSCNGGSVLWGTRPRSGICNDPRVGARGSQKIFPTVDAGAASPRPRAPVRPRPSATAPAALASEGAAAPAPAPAAPAEAAPKSDPEKPRAPEQPADKPRAADPPPPVRQQAYPVVRGDSGGLYVPLSDATPHFGMINGGGGAGIPPVAYPYRDHGYYLPTPPVFAAHAGSPVYHHQGGGGHHQHHQMMMMAAAAAATAAHPHTHARNGAAATAAAAEANEYEQRAQLESFLAAGNLAQAEAMLGAATRHNIQAFMVMLCSQERPLLIPKLVDRADYLGVTFDFNATVRACVGSDSHRSLECVLLDYQSLFHARGAAYDPLPSVMDHISCIRECARQPLRAECFAVANRYARAQVIRAVTDIAKLGAGERSMQCTLMQGALSVHSSVIADATRYTSAEPVWRDFTAFFERLVGSISPPPAHQLHHRAGGGYPAHSLFFPNHAD